MDYKSIQELIKTMSDSTLTSLEIETEGIQIKMGKEEKQVIVENPVKLDENKREANSATAFKVEDVKENVVVQVSEKATVDIKENEADDSDFVVTSPMVGTFYTSSGPESSPFVQVGKKVKKGELLCIIEAMKLMNEIEAEVDGEVVEILVENEQMVEYGQPLFRIKI